LVLGNLGGERRREASYGLEQRSDPGGGEGNTLSPGVTGVGSEREPEEKRHAPEGKHEPKNVCTFRMKWAGCSKTKLVRGEEPESIVRNEGSKELILG